MKEIVYKWMLTIGVSMSLSLISCGQQQPASGKDSSASGIQLLAPAAFSQQLAATKGVVLDVRTPGEYRKGHIEGARLLNIFDDTFEAELDKLDRGQTYFVYCAVGGRSEECVQLMRKKGFSSVIELDGGFNKWMAAGLPYVQ